MGVIQFSAGLSVIKINTYFCLLEKTKIMKSLKHLLISLVAAIVMIMILAPVAGQAQVVNSSAKKRISIGVGMFTDIWMNTPAGMKTRTINQGINVFGSYNMPFGKSNFSFAIGLGITIHNLYWNYYFKERTDSVQFSKVPSNVSYKRSKLTLPYLELPLEFRFKSKSRFAASVGFKLGYMIYGHTKWVGQDYIWGTGNTLKASFKDVSALEKFAYGPTVRVGYKWFHLNAYYSLTNIFNKGNGIDIYPISVGFVLLPF